jgi:Protein of unknown function (DUF3616)
MDVAGQVALRFTGGVHTGSHVNLTAARAAGEHLWVAGDETATLERLVLDTAVAPARAGRQRSFRLGDVVQLPGAADGESDIQGIACEGPWLWAIASHALVRRRPKPTHDEDKVVRRLGKLRRDPNRFVIVRLALQLGVDRRPEPVRVARDGRRSALVGAPGAETLVDLLRSDAHLAPFLAVPGRENGFDVAGLAIVGDRFYVGLRGPVLRGWAVVLELRPVQDPTDPGRLALGILPEGARYRKHFLDLGGLGVCDLCSDGSGDDADVLVLAGPTMPLPGPVRVHRWSAAARDGRRVLRDTDLPVEAVLAPGDGEDRTAGITLLAPDPLDPRARLLVVHDNPSAARRPWPDTVLADLVRIGPVPAAEESDAEPDGEPADGEPADDEAADGDAPDDLDLDPDPELPEPPGYDLEVPAPRHPFADEADAVPPPRFPDASPDASPDEADPAPADEPAEHPAALLHPTPDVPAEPPSDPGGPRPEPSESGFGKV